MFVGQDEYSANQIEVLYTFNNKGSTNNGAFQQFSAVPPHSHSWPGYNATWVFGEQFMPLLAKPIAGTLTIRIYPGIIRKSGSTGWIYIDTQIVDVSGDVPASDALWITLQANDSGTVDYVVGSTNVARASLDEGDIPEATTGRAIWAVTLEAGFNELFQNTIRNDFLDLRFDKGAFFVDAADVSFAPEDLNDWTSALDPGDAKDALDQLASRTADLEDAPPGAWDGDITDIDVTSSADIGEAIADDDQGIVYNTSGTAWVRFAWSRVKTYIQALTDTLYIAISGNVSQANMEELTDGSDNTAD